EDFGESIGELIEAMLLSTVRQRAAEPLDGMLGGIAGGEVVTCLLPAMKAVVAGWRQLIRQHCEGLAARSTDATTHPNVVVVLTQSPSVADDRLIAANGTSPRQEFQRNHPGSPLYSASGSAIKRITAGVRAAADRRCQASIWRLAFTLPGRISFE